MKTLALATAVALAATSSATPAPARAAVAASHIGTLRIFDTAFVPEHSGGAYPGVLRIAISSDGVVSGFYRPIDGTFTDVTGGLDGDRIWLDFGRRGTHLVGTYDGTTIRAATLGRACANVVDCTYTFRADPARA